MANSIILELLVSIMLASLGGIVRRLVESEKKHSKKKYSLSYYMAGAVISMFVGGVIWLLCKSFNLTEYVTAMFAAIGGYGGSPVLEKLERASVSKMQQAMGYKESDKEENDGSKKE